MREHEDGARDGAARQLRVGHRLLPGRGAADTPAAADHTGPVQETQMATGE